MIRGIGDSITSSSDRAKLKKLKNQFYQERNHIQNLSDALDSWCRTMWSVTETLLSSDGLLEVPVFDTARALEPIGKAEEIMSRLVSTNQASEYEPVIDLICQGLPFDPYFPIDAYTILYRIPQTNKREIQKIVRLFGIEEDYNIKKREVVAELLEPILSLPEKTIENIDNKICAFQELVKDYSDINVKKYITKLESQKQRILQAEAEAAAKAEEKAKRKAENEANFEAAKKLPEKTLEQLRTKYEALKALDSTPQITRVLNKVLKKLEEFESYAAFPSDLDPKVYAKKLVNNIVFRTVYDSLTLDIDHTTKLVSAKFSYHRIITKESINSTFKSALEEAKEYFAPYRDGEIPIILIPNSNINCKNGMLLTNQKGYIKQDQSDAQLYSFALNEIASIKITRRYNRFGYQFSAFRINDIQAFEIGFGSSECSDDITGARDVTIAQIIEFFVNYFLFIAAGKPDNKETFSSDVLESAGTSLQSFLESEPVIDESNYVIENSAPAPSQSKSSSSSGCFITSAVCHTFGKPDDCYELTMFRKFRDTWLSKQSEGPALIQEYYKIAPSIVEHIDQQTSSKEIYNSIWSAYLAPCLHYIENQQFDACKNTYITMVNNLKQKYLKVG